MSFMSTGGPIDGENPVTPTGWGAAIGVLLVGAIVGYFGGVIAGYVFGLISMIVGIIIGGLVGNEIEYQVSLRRQHVTEESPLTEEKKSVDDDGEDLHLSNLPGHPEAGRDDQLSNHGNGGQQSATGRRT